MRLAMQRECRGGEKTRQSVEDDKSADYFKKILQFNLWICATGHLYKVSWEHILSKYTPHIVVISSIKIFRNFLFKDDIWKQLYWTKQNKTLRGMPL
jgi:hypothetical protein